MKRFILALTALMFAPLGAFANGWALLTLDADGSAITSGIFNMDGEKVALYSKEECADRVRESILSRYSYATQFKYLGNGVFDASGAFGRIVCLASAPGAMDKFVANAQYGDVDFGAFLTGFGGRVESSITANKAAGYSIFPLDGDAEGIGYRISAELVRMIATRQNTSFDCDDPDLGTADRIVCYDEQLAGLDVALAKLFKEADERDSRRFKDARDDFKDEKAGIFFPAGLVKVYQETIARMDRRLRTP